MNSEIKMEFYRVITAAAHAMRTVVNKFVSPVQSNLAERNNGEGTSPKDRVSVLEAYSNLMGPAPKNKVRTVISSQIEGKKYEQTLYDCGAQVSIMSDKVYYQNPGIFRQPWLDPPKSMPTDANGSALNVTGQVKVNTILGKKHLSIT